MTINLIPGDELVVQLEGTGGEFRIHFDSETYPDSVVVEETNGCPDSKERGGVLYCE